MGTIIPFYTILPTLFLFYKNLENLGLVVSLFFTSKGIFEFEGDHHYV